MREERERPPRGTRTVHGAVHNWIVKGHVSNDHKMKNWTHVNQPRNEVNL